ncbi:MAG: hypothetical protein J5922_00825 [Clostridia bacterium]|nr:hypothetical protein [Clostridia bacterium]
MQKYIDLGAPVTDFEFIGDKANCLCKNDLVRIENKSVREYAVSASSIWEIVISNDMLFCGTVSGEQKATNGLSLCPEAPPFESKVVMPCGSFTLSIWRSLAH